MLLILAIWLASILIPIGFIYSVIRHLNGILRVGNNTAYLIDVIGNVICAELFNDLLVINKKMHPFGDRNETISEALGINYFWKNLTKLGYHLFALIELHDYKHFHKALNVPYNKETSKEKRKRIFKLIIGYFILSLVVLLLMLYEN